MGSPGITLARDAISLPSMVTWAWQTFAAVVWATTLVMASRSTESPSDI
jgi:hypothetical protein